MGYEDKCCTDVEVLFEVLFDATLVPADGSPLTAHFDNIIGTPDTEVEGTHMLPSGLDICGNPRLSISQGFVITSE